MTADLRREIKQARPFQTLEQEALLGLERTAAVHSHAFAEALKPYGVMPTQYNVIRILRGTGEPGLCRHEIRDRLVAQVPDVTRLLDRLEEAQLIERSRDAEDRRLVTTRITGKGLRLLRELDEPVLAMHKRQLGHMSREQLRALIDLLGVARGAD